MGFQKRNDRLIANLIVDVKTTKGEGRGSAFVKNLNKTGFLVEQADFHAVSGEPIGVEFPSTSARGRVMILGEVAWAKEGQAGIRVNGMLPHHRARYESLVSTIATGQSLLG